MMFAFFITLFLVGRHKVFDADDAPISLSRDDVKRDSMSDAIKWNTIQ